MKTTIKLPKFLSIGDEHRFFNALEINSAVTKAQGLGRALKLTIDGRKLTKSNTRELIALFCRYGIDLTFLKTLVSRRDWGWINDSESYWNEKS